MAASAGHFRTVLSIFQAFLPHREGPKGEKSDSRILETKLGQATLNSSHYIFSARSETRILRLIRRGEACQAPGTTNISPADDAIASDDSDYRSRPG